MATETTFIAKLDNSMLELVGAKDPTEFSAKFPAYLKAQSDKIATLEAREIPAAGVTEAKVKEIVSAELPAAMTTFAGSEAGKKVIGAEASRIVAAAVGATGGAPANPAPAAPAPDVAADTKALIEQGKFEEAYAASAELKAEFPDAQCYAAYAKAHAQGRVSVNQPK